jgi:ribosomal protein S18 acetylase RimI-like enzyme
MSQTKIQEAAVAELHTPYIIRMAQVLDAEAIAHIRVAAWRAAYRGLMPDSYLNHADLEDREAEYLRSRLQHVGDGICVSVADIGGRPMGYCAYGRAGDGAVPARGGVYDLYVHPDAWRRGVGQRLLAAAADYFRAQGFREATLFVFEGNMRARAFYERAGWKSDGHREMYIQPDYSLPVLRYWIRY